MNENKRYYVFYNTKNTDKAAGDYGLLLERVVAFQSLASARDFIRDVSRPAGALRVVGRPTITIDARG